MKEVKNQLKKLTGAPFVSNDTLPVRPAIVTVRPQTEPKKTFKALEKYSCVNGTFSIKGTRITAASNAYLIDSVRCGFAS